MESNALLILIAILLLLAVCLLVVLVLRRPGQLLERALREEQREGRGELRQQLDGLAALQEQRNEAFGRRLEDLARRTDERLDVLRETLTEDARKARGEYAEQQHRFELALGQRLQAMREQMDAFGRQQETRMQAFAQQQAELVARVDAGMAALRQALAEELARSRGEGADRKSTRLNS